MTDSLVHLVVALDAEAKPLASWFGLQRQRPDKGFPIFRHAHIALVVCGPGKANAAAGTAHLHAVCGFPRNGLWVNIGIGGHRELPVGSTRIAHAVEDAASGRAWYPPLAFTPPWPSEYVRTVDRPDATYSCEGIVDMEASGFYATACRFSTSELVHAVKVVSDNRERALTRLRAVEIVSLLGQQLDAVDLLLHRLGRLANELAESDPMEDADLAPYLARWHFSASQRIQLAEQIRRWLVRCGDAPWPEGIDTARSATEAIRLLSEYTDRQALRLP